MKLMLYNYGSSTCDEYDCKRRERVTNGFCTNRYFTTRLRVLQCVRYFPVERSP